VRVAHVLDVHAAHVVVAGARWTGTSGRFNAGAGRDRCRKAWPSSFRAPSARPAHPSARPAAPPNKLPQAVAPGKQWSVSSPRPLKEAPGERSVPQDRRPPRGQLVTPSPPAAATLLALGQAPLRETPAAWAGARSARSRKELRGMVAHGVAAQTRGAEARREREVNC
jgi:hypothetical protein